MAIIQTVVAGGGVQPTGTKNITTNGTHNVAAYEYADVQVPTTAPTLYREFGLDNSGTLIPNKTTTTIMDFTGVKGVSDYALRNAYYQNTAISGAVNLSDLTTVSGVQACSYMFSDCTGITSVDLSSLTTISGNTACSYMFFSCYALTSADLSSLVTVSSTDGCKAMFQASGVTSANLPSLVTVSGSSCLQWMFHSCQALTSANLSSLTTLSGSTACSAMFYNCINLTSLSLPSITPDSFGSRVNQFTNMCQGITNITLHFPSNTQAKVSTLTGYSTTAPFGATAGTILFDLPATYTLTGADSNTYTRNPKYDTATALAWKVGAYGTTDFTPAYYTSGTTNPQANDTIYSDAACTTAVTTISAIS